MFKTSQFGKKEIRPAEKLEDVNNYGLWHLSRREHSINELRTKLGRKTDNPEWIEESINYLKQLKYLDDERYIQNFLKDCNEYKKYGPSRIKQELKLKGIDKELINQTFLDSEFDYFESAVQCLNRKCRDKITDRKEKDKLTRFLLSKGFSFDMIKYAFEKHLK